MYPKKFIEKVVVFPIYILRNFCAYFLTFLMMMNCFCGVVNRRKAFSLISSRDHCQRSWPTRISDPIKAIKSCKRNWILESPLACTGCLSIQFFSSPHSPNIVSETAWGSLPITVQHFCDLQDATLLLGHQVFPTLTLA